MNLTTTIVLALGVALIAFLVLREVFCWYWKQTEQVQLLKQIAASLEALEARTGAAPVRPSTPSIPSPTKPLAVPPPRTVPATVQAMAAKPAPQGGFWGWVAQRTG